MGLLNTHSLPRERYGNEVAPTKFHMHPPCDPAMNQPHLDDSVLKTGWQTCDTCSVAETQSTGPAMHTAGRPRTPRRDEPRSHQKNWFVHCTTLQLCENRIPISEAVF